MSTLVTGASGCLGKEICNLLNCDVVKFIGDIRNPMNFNQTFDSVIHAAAVKRDRPKDETYDVNVNGTKNLLDYCEKQLVKSIKLISSSEVFGNSDYGLSKLEMEKLTTNYNLPICCIRLPTIFGTTSSLLDVWINTAKKGLPLKLFLFEGRSKKKFFIQLNEAAQFVTNLQVKKSIDYPKCQVIDTEILAAIVADHFGVKIKMSIGEGKPFEFLDDKYCSDNFETISYEQAKIITKKYLI